MKKHPFQVVVGLDRSDAKLDVCVIQTRAGKESQSVISTRPEALQKWVHQLRQSHRRARIAICFEQPANNLIAFLDQFEFITLFALNPMTLKNFRETFRTSRARHDALDAYFLAQLLLTHPERLKPWQPDDLPTRRLGRLVRDRRAVVDERTALSNRLKDMLKNYFPQALSLCGEELWRPLATRFLAKWPTLQAVQKAKPETLRQFYHLNGSRSQKRIQERLELIEQAVPLTEDPALLESFTLRVALVIRELELVVRTLKDYDRRITEAFAQHPDKPIFASFPGAGPTFAPRLLTCLGSCRDRFPDAKSLQAFSGIAPVTKESGKMRLVHRRYLCPVFLRQGFHEYAKESILHCRWAAAYYRQQRQKGLGHNTAVRALAYKWQRIMWRCWLDRVPYDDARYETALEQSQSPLAVQLKTIEVGKFPYKNENVKK